MSQEVAVEDEQGFGDEGEEGCPTSCGQPVVPCPKRKKRKVSYLWRPPPPSPRPSYSPCPHIYFKKLKEERQKELSRDERIGVLSTPSKHPWQKSTLPRPQLVRYRKRQVTARNLQLAVPKLQRVQALFEEQRDCGVLEIARLERLEAMLQEEFLLSPVQAKKIVKSVKRRKKKKMEVCDPCPFLDERVPSTEFSRENFMKGMITEIANHVSDVTEIKQGPTAKRVGEIVTAIMERIEGLVDEETPPPDPAQNFGEGKLSQLLVTCAGRMAGWIENVIYEADKAVIENFEAADAENRPPPCDHDILPCGHLPMLPCGHQVIVPCSFHTTACYPPPPREPKPSPPCTPCDPCCHTPPPPPCKEWVPCYDNAPKCGKKKSRKGGKKKHKKKKSRPDDDDEECRCSCECEPPSRRKGKKGKKGKGKGKKGKKGGGGDDEETLVGQQKDREGDGDTEEETEGEGGESEVEGGGGASETEGGEGGGGGDDSEEPGQGSKAPGSKSPSAKTSPGKTPPKTPTSGSKAASPSKSPEKSPPPKSPSAGKSPPKSADKTPGDKSPAKSGEKTPAKSGEKSPAKSGEKTPAKSGEKTPAKSGEKSPAKSGDKSGEKSPAKSPPKSGEKTPQKVSGGGTPGKSGSKPTSGSATPGKSPRTPKTPGGAEGGDGAEGEGGEEGADAGGEPDGEAQDQQIADMGEALAEEAIEGALAEETEETATFNSILEQLSFMVDDIPDKDPDKRRVKLTKTLEDKFTELLGAEGADTAEIDEATKQTIIKVATKIANWMEDVIDEAESRLSSLVEDGMAVALMPPVQRVPSPVTSESVRDWASWIVEAMAVADDWAEWISKTVRAAEEKAAKKKGMVVKEDGGVAKLTRMEYQAWKEDVKSGAVDYRMKKRYIAETAYDWKKRTHDRPISHRPKPGDPTTSANADEAPAPPPDEEAPPPEE